MTRIAVAGGTGNLGNAIARRLAKAGHDVAIGSRSAGFAGKAAAEIGGAVRSGANADVAADTEIVIVAAPYSVHAATMKEIAPFEGDAAPSSPSASLPPSMRRARTISR